MIVVEAHAGDVMARAAVEAGFQGEIQVVPDAEEAGRRAERLLEPGDMALVKGSRGIGLEVVVEALVRRQENNG